MKLKPTILVVGATVAQGGSVARHLVQSGQFFVRGLTRHPQSENANALARMGVTIVPGDLSDKASLLKALNGCDGVFGVTNFWEHFEKEYEQGKNLVDAVVERGVRQFVFSTLPHIYGITKGAVSVRHFDIKAQLEAYARFKKPDTTFVHLAFYYQNFLSYFTPQKGADGSYFISFPQGDAPLAAISARDTGGIVRRIFEQPETFAGKTIEAAGEMLTGAGYAEILSKVTGKKIQYMHMPRQVFARQQNTGAEEIAAMFDYYRQYQPYGAKAIKESQQLYPELKGFEQEITDSKDALLAVM